MPTLVVGMSEWRCNPNMPTISVGMAPCKSSRTHTRNVGTRNFYSMIQSIIPAYFIETSGSPSGKVAGDCQTFPLFSTLTLIIFSGAIFPGSLVDKTRTARLIICFFNEKAAHARSARLVGPETDGKTRGPRSPHPPQCDGRLEDARPEGRARHCGDLAAHRR